MNRGIYRLCHCEESAAGGRRSNLLEAKKIASLTAFARNDTKVISR